MHHAMEMQDVIQELAWTMHQVPPPITMRILTVTGIFSETNWVFLIQLFFFFCFSFLNCFYWSRLGRGPTGYGTGSGSSRTAMSGSLYGGRNQGLSYPGGTLIVSCHFVPALIWIMFVPMLFQYTLLFIALGFSFPNKFRLHWSWCRVSSGQWSWWYVLVRLSWRVPVSGFWCKFFYVHSPLPFRDGSSNTVGYLSLTHFSGRLLATRTLPFILAEV